MCVFKWKICKFTPHHLSSLCTQINVVLMVKTFECLSPQLFRIHQVIRKLATLDCFICRAWCKDVRPEQDTWGVMCVHRMILR